MLRYLILIAFLFILAVPSFAQEADYWTDQVRNYDKYQHKKIVSEEEIQEAVKTLQEYKGKNNKGIQRNSGKKWYQFWKKDKKPSRGGQGGMMNKILSKTKKDDDEPKPLPDSKLLLFRLPYTVHYGNTIIRDGYYLIDVKNKDNQLYIRFIQGNKTIADVYARYKDFDKKVSGQGSSFVDYEVIKDSFIKIYYKKHELKLETLLPIYKRY